jgi:hypothetical protein
LTTDSGTSRQEIRARISSDQILVATLFLLGENTHGLSCSLDPGGFNILSSVLCMAICGDPLRDLLNLLSLWHGRRVCTLFAMCTGATRRFCYPSLWRRSVELIRPILRGSICARQTPFGTCVTGAQSVTLDLMHVSFGCDLIYFGKEKQKGNLAIRRSHITTNPMTTLTINGLLSNCAVGEERRMSLHAQKGRSHDTISQLAVPGRFQK